MLRRRAFGHGQQLVIVALALALDFGLVHRTNHSTYELPRFFWYASMHFLQTYNVIVTHAL